MARCDFVGREHLIAVGPSGKAWESSLLERNIRGGRLLRRSDSTADEADGSGITSCGAPAGGLAVFLRSESIQLRQGCLSKSSQ